MTRFCLDRYRRHRWHVDQETYVYDENGHAEQASQQRFCWRMCGTRQVRAISGKKRGPWVDLTADAQGLAHQMLHRGRVLRLRPPNNR